MRYLIHETQAQEICGRQDYLYDIFHLYFLPKMKENGFIPLVPLGYENLNILFITGHMNQVNSYMDRYIETVPEEIIVVTTCFASRLLYYKRAKTIFVPKGDSDFCYIRKGIPYGFSFDITDAELDFYNATGSIMERIQSAYDQL